MPEPFPDTMMDTLHDTVSDGQPVPQPEGDLQVPEGELQVREGDLQVPGGDLQVPGDLRVPGGNVQVPRGNMQHLLDLEVEMFGDPSWGHDSWTDRQPITPTEIEAQSEHMDDGPDTDDDMDLGILRRIAAQSDFTDDLLVIERISQFSEV